MRNSVSVLYSRPLCSYPVRPSQGENGRSGWQILEQWAELAREGDCRVWLEGQDTNELSFLHLLRVPRDRSHRWALSLAAWSLPLLRVSLSQTGELSPLRPRYCSRQPLPAFQFLCLSLSVWGSFSSSGWCSLHSTLLTEATGQSVKEMGSGARPGPPASDLASHTRFAHLTIFISKGGRKAAHTVW